MAEPGRDVRAPPQIVRGDGLGSLSVLGLPKRMLGTLMGHLVYGLVLGIAYDAWPLN